ncbi:MAG: hypothetical protein CVV56_06040 [Tenericutes bacterium HGW-Tenericutes-1]|jgi:hypothetical protein|nr:MAG: hypothetical protein CVV56_06040 [Tenericutes bacterium HGW-Tenericutes-1]
MQEKSKFLNYLQERLNIQSDDLADFLFIDIRTLYNYKKHTINTLPSKVKEKLIIFFQGYEEFYQEDLTVDDIYQKLESADTQVINYIRTKFLEVAAIRKKTYVITSTKELLKKTEIKRNVNSLDEFLVDFKILIEYSNLSKGYLYSIFEIIISKINSENDYMFLDYIHKYKKEE